MRYVTLMHRELKGKQARRATVRIAPNPFDLTVDRDRGLIIVKEGPHLATVGQLHGATLNVPERLGHRAAQNLDFEISDKYPSQRGLKNEHAELLEKLTVEELESLSAHHGVEIPASANKSKTVEKILKTLGVEQPEGGNE